MNVVLDEPLSGSTSTPLTCEQLGRQRRVQRSPGATTPQRSTIAGSPQATIDDDGGFEVVRRRSRPASRSGSALMTWAQVETVGPDVSDGAPTLTAGSTAPDADGDDPPECEPAPPSNSPATMHDRHGDGGRDQRRAAGGGIDRRSGSRS